MFTLVRFDDKSFGIYSSRKISCEKNGNCIVNHNGTKYMAELVSNGTKEDLLKLKEQYDEGDSAGELQSLRPTTELTRGVKILLQRSTELNSTSVADSQSCTGDKDSIQKPLKLQVKRKTDSSVESSPVLNYTSCENDLSDDSCEDPDFEPSGQSSHSSENDSMGDEENEAGNGNMAKEKEPNSSLDISYEQRRSAPNDDQLIVEKSRGRQGDRKANFCFYCHIKQQKISRHFELKHSDEPEVKKFIHLPKRNAERTKLIGILRKKGNFLFNTDKSLNDGSLIVSRRPRSDKMKRACDFRPCANCRAFFSKGSLRAHYRKCTGRLSKHRREVNLMSKKVSNKIHSIATKVVKTTLFPPLREDDITNLVRYDELVILYANKMCEKYKNPRYFEMIRQRIRLIGRFLLTAKRIDKNITNLSSVFDPKFCDCTSAAINAVARFNAETKLYEAPTVAFNLQTLLKQIGNIFIAQTIKTHNEEGQKNAKNYLKLLTQEVSVAINRTVLECQEQIRRKQKVLMPSMDDIKKLNTYLNSKRAEYFRSLTKKFSFSTWTKLSEVTLSSVQVFNRRRAGEVERILIEDYKNYQRVDSNTDKDLFEALPEKSKVIAEKYVRFTIRGKLNRTVPVLLDNNLVQCIELIIKYRTQAGVKDKNPYVFGIPYIGDAFKYLRACALLRKFSSECGAEHPERLRGTKLRKHIATTCINLNLQEQDISDLANFMGHHQSVHKQIYRQSMNTDILKMSKLLEVAQGRGNSSDESESEEENASHSKSTPAVVRKRRSSPHGTISRRPWTREEIDIVNEAFGELMLENKLPSLRDIQILISNHPALQTRTSPQVKSWVSNQLVKKRKLSFRD